MTDGALIAGAAIVGGAIISVALLAVHHGLASAPTEDNRSRDRKLRAEVRQLKEELAKYKQMRG